jgi:hypothetical protein
MFINKYSLFKITMEVNKMKITTKVNLYRLAIVDKAKSFMNQTKAILGLSTVEEVMLSFFILSVTGFALLLSIGAITSTGVITSSSSAYNGTQSIFGNVTGGLVSFFGIAPTAFAMLGIAVFIFIVGLIIYAVSRFRGNATGGAGTGGGTLG